MNIETKQNFTGSYLKKRCSLSTFVYRWFFKLTNFFILARQQQCCCYYSSGVNWSFRNVWVALRLSLVMLLNWSP